MASAAFAISETVLTRIHAGNSAFKGVDPYARTATDSLLDCSTLCTGDDCKGFGYDASTNDCLLFAEWAITGTVDPSSVTQYYDKSTHCKYNLRILFY